MVNISNISPRRSPSPGPIMISENTLYPQKNKDIESSKEETLEVIEFGESEDKTSIQDEKFELKESEDDREKIKRDRIKKIQENMKKLGF